MVLLLNLEYKSSMLYKEYSLVIKQCENMLRSGLMALLLIIYFKSIFMFLLEYCQF